MDRSAIVPVMALAIVNGIFSPWVLGVFLLYPVWFPGWLPPYAQIVYFLSALILSTLTLMVAGVPAALYERFSSRPGSPATGMIWLAGAALLTLPAIPNVLRALGMA